ncbi:MAG: 2-hydroxyacyl-CoA dehydratase family protein, partial [Lachnospiraceae bacterium]|nr:2-hydroxyacyl-CoA dehydratase family protein [Lachnospiraceae bacterium]
MAEPNGINERQRELFIRKSTRVAASYLKRAKALSEMPDAAKPFFDVLENVYIRLTDVQKPEDVKSIGTLCVMVPAELVYAAGAMPVRLCSGSYTAYSVGDDYIPRDACPLVKAVMGFGMVRALPAFDNCSLLVAPVTCDCKKKLAGVIDTVRNTVPLHVPPLKKEDADTEVFLKELYRLIPILEKETGMQVTARSLAEGINIVGNAQYEMSEFLKYRRHDPALMSGTQVLSVMNAYSYMPVNMWAQQMHRLNAQMKQRLEQGHFVSRKNQPRILVTGSPIAFPNIKIPLLVEEMGGVLAADETCMGERGLYDPVSVIDPSFDGMMRALASRYTKPCTCPVFVDNSQRIYRIKQMIKE